MGRTQAIARKEFLHIIRDRRTLILIVFMPFMQLITYGYAINTDVKHLTTVLYDEDRTALSRRLVNAFEQSAYFNMIERTQSFETLHKYLDKGKLIKFINSKRKWKIAKMQLFYALGDLIVLQLLIMLKKI